MCPSEVAGVQAADLGGDGRDVDRPGRVHGDQRADGVTHTRDEMLPLASRNPNDGRGGQGPFEMADLQRHSLEDDKEDRREYRYQADDPEGHGFDALRDSTLRIPCSSCASKYLV
jgi:hypothetical protein